MQTMRDELNASLKKFEADLLRRQQAIEHLRQAIQLINEESSTESPSPVRPDTSSGHPPLPPREGVASLVDQFIATLQDGDSFGVRDAVQAVVNAGYPQNETVRANVSSILSRRTKNGELERIGSRGLFAKPLNEQGEAGGEPNETTQQAPLTPAMAIPQARAEAIKSVFPRDLLNDEIPF